VVAVAEDENLGKGVHRITDLVEKPRREDAPSNLAIIGRYILTPDIFETLATTERDKSGEIQLTNGLRALLKRRPIFAYEIDGIRHDTGNKLGFLKAMVHFALKREDLAGPFKAYLKQVGAAD
jgi:UTP--glucose-1-phosphate uridylyltransferase